MDELTGLMLSQMAMTCTERVQIDVAVSDLWLILNALQLTSTHPDLHEQLKEIMADIGSRIQRVIVTVVPELEELASAGWQREHDVDTEQDDPGAPDGWYDDDDFDVGDEIEKYCEQYPEDCLNDQGEFTGVPNPPLPPGRSEPPVSPPWHDDTNHQDWEHEL